MCFCLSAPGPHFVLANASRMLRAVLRVGKPLKRGVLKR